jgi:hypothetical protein
MFDLRWTARRRTTSRTSPTRSSSGTRSPPFQNYVSVVSDAAKNKLDRSLSSFFFTASLISANSAFTEYQRGKYHCTIDLLFDWVGISCMTTDNFCFYLQNRLIQTSQTGNQQYSDTFPFSIPWCLTLRTI